MATDDAVTRANNLRRMEGETAGAFYDRIAAELAKPYERGWFAVMPGHTVDGFDGEAFGVWDMTVNKTRLVFGTEALAIAAVNALHAASELGLEELEAAYEAQRPIARASVGQARDESIVSPEAIVASVLGDVELAKRIEETRTINGQTISSFRSAGGWAVLVRRSREDRECDDLSHDRPNLAILKGAAYIEELSNGSRDTGERWCLPCAIRREVAVVS